MVLDDRRLTGYSMETSRFQKQDELQMATPAPDPLSNPQKFAEAGERIYAEHKADLERENMGRFVAIDVATGKYYIDDAAERALDAGRAEQPSGIFHLIRIGYPGAYKLSYSLNADRDQWF